MNKYSLKTKKLLSHNMLKKLDNKKILNEINENGFSIIENYFDKPDLKIIEQNLLDTLNYIDFDTEKDLKKKYFKIKKDNPKLKGKWYDISAFNIDMLRFLHSETIINLVKEFFKTNVVFSGRPAIHVHDAQASGKFTWEDVEYDVGKLGMWSDGTKNSGTTILGELDTPELCHLTSGLQVYRRRTQLTKAVAY